MYKLASLKVDNLLGLGMVKRIEHWRMQEAKGRETSGVYHHLKEEIKRKLQ